MNLYRRGAASFPLIAAVVVACGRSSTDFGSVGVHEIWYQQQAGVGRARPAVNGATVFFGTGDGQVIARNVQTGAITWSAKVSQDAIKGATLLARANVVVAPAVFQTVGLDLQTGRELWRYSAPPDTVGFSPASASPGTVIDSRIDADAETVYIPAWGASVSALDLESGNVRWVWQPGKIETDTARSGVFASGSTGVRVSGDTVFVSLWHFTNRTGGSSEGWLVAIDRVSGGELWRVRLPVGGSGVMLQSAPALYKNLVILHTLSAKTFAIDRSTQEVSWDFSATNATLSTLSSAEISGDIVYVDGGDGRMYALQAGTGQLVWSSAFGNASARDLLVTPHNIIFPTGAELHILDRITGNPVRTIVQPHTTDPLFASAASYLNGMVFVTVSDGAWCFEDP